MKNEKTAVYHNGGSTNFNEQMNYKPNQTKFQYKCSFCLRELPNGGIRFDGIGACPMCNRLAHLFVGAKRQHRANHFLNLGVRK